MKWLSVCIPTYNREESLKRQIDYFLPFVKKYREDVELIVSNNYSTDGTTAYLESKRDCPELIINHNKENAGLIGNLRVVTAMASGQYIWVVGDDDQLYDGTAEKILDLIKGRPNLGHVFLNYYTIIGTVLNNTPVYSGKAGYFDDGFELFSAITERSTLGANLFLTANVFKGELLKEANCIVDEFGEAENMSLPLGWSLFCSSLPGYIVENPCLEDQAEGISWSDSKTRVFYRDHFALCDKLAARMGISNEMNNLMIHNMPSTYPAIKFAFLNKNSNLDNYAGKWLWSNYKLAYIKDIILFPFYLAKLALKMIGRKIIEK